MQKITQKARRHLGAALAVGATLALAAPAMGQQFTQDWNGGYAGVFGGSGFSGSDVIYGAWGGYNARLQDFVLGAEAEIYGYRPSQADAFAKVRLGYVTNESLMLYSTLGVGACLTCATNLWLGGIGMEYNLGGATSLRLEADKENTAGSPLLSGPGFVKVGIGWNF